jgi:hypothetical protein
MARVRAALQVVTMAMDRKDPEREAASLLLASLYPKMISQARHATTDVPAWCTNALPLHALSTQLLQTGWMGGAFFLQRNCRAGAHHFRGWT